ncbi:MAG: Wzz/FepE/Etk N-terminal domain-containing protein [Betaproteobacteria bacterium]
MNQDDEIDLAELLAYLWSKKKFIALFTASFSVIAIVYSLWVTPLWDVRGTLRETTLENQMQIPSSIGAAASLFGVNVGGQQSNSNLPILQSRAIIENFILENDLLPILFEDLDEDVFVELSEDQLIYRAVTLFFDEVLTINQDPASGLITVIIRWRDPEIAYQWNLGLIDLANRDIRENDLRLAENFYSYLNSELGATNSVELRQSIASMIEAQMQTIMLANADAEYAFSYIDPPRIPDMRAYPRRSLMVILSFIASLFVSVIGLLVIRAFKDQR